MDLNEQIEQIEETREYKTWWLICPACAWFAGFSITTIRPASMNAKICSTCNTLLLWEGLDPPLNRLIKELRNKDPHASDRCGNNWSGFTSKLAFTAIADPNDIGWWLR